MCLELHRSVPKYIGARTLGTKVPGLLAGVLSPLRHVDRKEPQPPDEGWARLAPRMSGICGSDLNTLSGPSSLYFSALVSMPFVLGHEVVADLLDDADNLPAGQRVVIDPALSCAPPAVPPASAPSCSRQPSPCER